MGSYEFSEEALDDLAELLTYVAGENMPASDALEEDLRRGFEYLARYPGTGHRRRDLTERDVRFWAVGSYLIVYRALPDRVQIAAILHGSRDIPRVLGES